MKQSRLKMADHRGENIYTYLGRPETVVIYDYLGRMVTVHVPRNFFRKETRLDAFSESAFSTLRRRSR